MSTEWLFFSVFVFSAFLFANLTLQFRKLSGIHEKNQKKPKTEYRLTDYIFTHENFN